MDTKDLRKKAVLTMNDVAELLELGRTTVYEKARQGLIPGVRRIGRIMRVSSTEFFAWLDGQNGGNGGKSAGS